jgi:hypothetical protein
MWRGFFVAVITFKFQNKRRFIEHLYNCSQNILYHGVGCSLVELKAKLILCELVNKLLHIVSFFTIYHLNNGSEGTKLVFLVEIFRS